MSKKNREAAGEFMKKSVDTLATFNPKLALVATLWHSLVGDWKSAKKTLNKATFGLSNAAIDGKTPDFRAMWDATPPGLISNAIIGDHDRVGKAFENILKAHPAGKVAKYMFIEPDFGMAMAAAGNALASSSSVAANTYSNVQKYGAVKKWVKDMDRAFLGGKGAGDLIFGGLWTKFSHDNNLFKYAHKLQKATNANCV